MASIRGYWPNGTNDTYTCHVYFDNSGAISTTVTSDPAVVMQWISEVSFVHYSYGRGTTVVGLDIEWRPTFGPGPQNPTATLQLCTGDRCLIYQLIHTSYIPRAVDDFLSDRNYIFVGVGIGSDVQRLSNDYGINLGGSTVDLRRLAVDWYGRTELRNWGLKDLARLVLEREMEKPPHVTVSRWDNRRLTEEQVQYACIDAFVSMEIGIALNAGNNY